MDLTQSIQTGGPAGCLIASNLAHSAQRPSVLLLEAGSDYKDVNLRIDGQRWLTYQKHPSMNWGYKTAPQEYCSNREIDYSRGKGKGGSSNINFGFYTVGAKDDYDEWARVVENDAFKWENMQRRFKLIETFHGKVPNGEEKYAAPHPSDHGHAGPIHVGYAQEWERDLTPLLDVFEQAGFPSNMDHNSGNPIGMSVVIASAHGGMRSTAADVLITPPINLTIYTDCTVQRLLIRGKTVVGVQCDQQKCSCYSVLTVSTTS
jgi:choline dehydrogenase-like flavoprotein